MHVSLSATHTFEAKRVYQRQNKGLKRVISLATQGIYLKSVYRGKSHGNWNKKREREREREKKEKEKRERKKEKRERKENKKNKNNTSAN